MIYCIHTSLVKTTPLLWLHNKPCLSQQKKLFKRNGLSFHWCLYNKYNITWPLAWRYKKRNFISPRGYVIISAISKTVLYTISG